MRNKPPKRPWDKRREPTQKQRIRQTRRQFRAEIRKSPYTRKKPAGRVPLGLLAFAVVVGVVLGLVIIGPNGQLKVAAGRARSECDHRACFGGRWGHPGNSRRADPTVRHRRAGVSAAVRRLRRAFLSLRPSRCLRPGRPDQRAECRVHSAAPRPLRSDGGQV